MEKLGVEKYHVVGTSYGGFVAFRMAEMWQDRVMKVVIANSAVNGLLSDSMELVKRGKVEKIEDLIMPEKASELRKLMNLSVFRRAYVPDFILNDFINVSILFAGDHQNLSCLHFSKSQYCHI